MFSRGSARPPRGGPADAVYNVNIQREGIWAVIVGGAEGYPTTNFDHLTFEIDEPSTSVPAPNPLTLLLIGLAVITIRMKFRSQLK